MISCPVVRAAEITPNKTFIVEGSLRLTFREFAAQVLSVQQDLIRQESVRLASKEPLSRQLLFVPAPRNSQSIAHLFAAMSLGLLAVPIDSAWPEKRVEHLLLSFNATLFAKEAYVSPAQTTPENNINEQTPCLGIFTSGSTGPPKLVIHSYQTLLSNAQSSNSLIPLETDDRTALSLPLHHIGGFSQVLRCLISQTCLVIADAIDQATTLVDYDITHTSMVSTQLQRLVTHNARIPKLKAILVGGGPLPESLSAQAKKLAYPIWQSYGMSETASQLITRSPDQQEFMMGGNRVKLSDSGEIFVKGPSLFLGYWQQQEMRQARDQEGWFHTRDIAKRVDDITLIVGRCDNQFTSGGENVQPEEIERALNHIPGIKRSVVVPYPHSEFGSVPFAFLQLDDQLCLSVEQKQHIIRVLKKDLPGYLVPKHYARLANDGLKPKRKELELLAQAQDKLI